MQIEQEVDGTLARRLHPLPHLRGLFRLPEMRPARFGPLGSSSKDRAEELRLRGDDMNIDAACATHEVGRSVDTRADRAVDRRRPVAISPLLNRPGERQVRQHELGIFTRGVFQ